MSFEITRWAWDQTGLDHNAKYALLALADMADEKGECWPSIPTLAERMGYSKTSTRTVRTGLTTLEGEGIVTIKKRKRPGTNSQITSKYTIHWKKKVVADSPEVVASSPEGGSYQPYESTNEPTTEPTTLPNAINSVDDPKIPIANSEAADTEIRGIVKGIYEWTPRAVLDDALAEQLNPIYEDKYGIGARDLGHMIVNERYGERLCDLIEEHQTSKGNVRGLDYAIAQWVGTITNDYNRS